MHLQQVSRTQRQIVELTLNAVIDGIVIKPREKGQTKFRKCEPAFPSSAEVLIMDQLFPFKCFRNRREKT